MGRFIVIGIVLTALLLGVLFITRRISNAGDTAKVSQTTSASGVIDYGNGVYYFPFNRAAYANALSKFIQDHPDLRLVSQAGDGTDFQGTDGGYFVIFEPRVQKE